MDYYFELSSEVKYVQMMIHKFKQFSHLKNFKTRHDWLEAVWLDLISYIQKSSVEDINALLRHIITPHEKQILLRRAIAVDRFSTGTHYRSVAEETWLSNQALYAIRRGLKNNLYLSDWESVKLRIAEKKEKRRFFSERPEPIHYRRTKFGRTRAW